MTNKYIDYLDKKAAEKQEDLEFSLKKGVLPILGGAGAGSVVDHLSKGKTKGYAAVAGAALGSAFGFQKKHEKAAEEEPKKKSLGVAGGAAIGAGVGTAGTAAYAGTHLYKAVKEKNLHIDADRAARNPLNLPEYRKLMQSESNFRFGNAMEHVAKAVNSKKILPVAVLGGALAGGSAAAIAAKLGNGNEGERHPQEDIMKQAGDENRGVGYYAAPVVGGVATGTIAATAPHIEEIVEDAKYLHGAKKALRESRKEYALNKAEGKSMVSSGEPAIDRAISSVRKFRLAIDRRAILRDIDGVRDARGYLRDSLVEAKRPAIRGATVGLLGGAAVAGGLAAYNHFSKKASEDDRGINPVYPSAVGGYVGMHAGSHIAEPIYRKYHEKVLLPRAQKTLSEADSVIESARRDYYTNVNDKYKYKLSGSGFVPQLHNKVHELNKKRALIQGKGPIAAIRRGVNDLRRGVADKELNFHLKDDTQFNYRAYGGRDAEATKLHNVVHEANNAVRAAKKKLIPNVEGAKVNGKLIGGAAGAIGVYHLLKKNEPKPEELYFQP